MSDMETTAQERAQRTFDPDALLRDYDRALVRVAELEAEVDVEKRWRKVCLDGSAARIAKLEAAVLAEREACLAINPPLVVNLIGYGRGWLAAIDAYHAAIRARPAP